LSTSLVDVVELIELFLLSLLIRLILLLLLPLLFRLILLLSRHRHALSSHKSEADPYTSSILPNERCEIPLPWCLTQMAVEPY